MWDNNLILFLFFPSFGPSGQEERTRWGRWLSSSNPGRARGTWLWTTTQRNSFKVRENGQKGAKAQFLVSSGLHKLGGLLGLGSSSSSFAWRASTSLFLHLQPHLEVLHLLLPPSPGFSISSFTWRSSTSFCLHLLGPPPPASLGGPPSPLPFSLKTEKLEWILEGS